MSEVSFYEVENDSIDRLGGVKRDDCEMETVDDSRESENLKRNRGKPYTKKTHSDIEKRRRDKMNTYINELSTMIPMCSNTSRKLDKLTVLRMAVQHMKSLRETSKPFTETKYKPAFLSDDDLKYLILDAAEGFLLVVSCDRACILYMSDTISESLNYTQSDVVGDSFFDLVHPKDVGKIKEQLVCPDTVPREHQTDNKSRISLQARNEVHQEPVKMCSGSRRSFYCRMKKDLRCRRTKENELDINDRNTSISWKNTMRPSHTADNMQYEIVHFSGFLKSWPSTNCGIDEEDDDAESKNSTCLVCVGQVATIYDEQTDFSQPGVVKEFVSRHGVDGRYVWVDHRMAIITGWLPQEIVGRSAYEYIYSDDLASISAFHKKALLEEGPLAPTILRLRCKAGHYLPVKSNVTVFTNPCTKEPEFIICENQVLVDYDQSQQLEVAENAVGRPHTGADFSSAGAVVTVRRMVGSEQMDLDNPINVPGVDRIGAMIVEAVQQRRAENNLRPSGADSRKASPRRMGQTSGTCPSLYSHTQSSSTTSYGALVQDDTSGQSRSQVPELMQTSLSSSSSNQSSPCTNQEAQPYLLEQLIGMQDAIDQMERIAPHNEDTMAAFMNSLMTETGLTGNE